MMPSKGDTDMMFLPAWLLLPMPTKILVVAIFLALIVSIVLILSYILEERKRHWFPFCLRIVQIRNDSRGDPHMAINGIVKGQTGSFAEVPLPPGSAFPAGTTFTWTADDPNVTLTPSTDGTQVAVATSATDTATSFNLTCTSSFTAPGTTSPVAGTANVPLLTPPPPTPTSIQINQTS